MIKINVLLAEVLVKLDKNYTRKSSENSFEKIGKFVLFNAWQPLHPQYLTSAQEKQITPGWSCIWEVSRGKDIFDTNQKFQMLCQEGLLESFVSRMKDFHTILAVKKKATGENRTLKSDPEVSQFKRIVLLSKFPKSRPSQFSCL